jgi:hypothetical protein
MYGSIITKEVNLSAGSIKEEAILDGGLIAEWNDHTKGNVWLNGPFYKEIVFTAEDLERMYKESAEEQELKSFDKLLAELAESGTKLIKDYHTATKSCEDLQKEVYSIRAELTATRDLLESFEQGNIVAPELQDKFINYLTDLSKKPGSKKTAIDKAIKWIKNNCK